MQNKTAEQHINEMLTGNTRKKALDFVSFLRAREMLLERGGGYWADKCYWGAWFDGEPVCTFLIGAEEARQAPDNFIIWSDNSGSGWYENAEIDEQSKEIFWQNVDICGSCGFCPGGTGKTVFSREFDSVCTTTFRFDNPNADAIKCAMIMAELRKNDITLNKNREN